MIPLAEKQSYVTIPLDDYKKLTDEIESLKDKFKNAEIKAAHTIDFKYNVTIDLFKNSKYSRTLRIEKSHYIDERQDLKQILEETLKLAVNSKFKEIMKKDQEYIKRLEGYCEEHRTDISKLEDIIKNYKEEIEIIKNIKSKWWYKLFYNK